MAIIFQHVKGAPLSANDFDNNFHEIDARLKRLESGHHLVEGLGRIDLDGADLVVTGTWGTPLGRFRYLPQWRGDWLAGETYAVFDAVADLNGLYVCQEAHTSNDFQAEQAKWVRILQGVRQEVCHGTCACASTNATSMNIPSLPAQS